MMFWLIELLLMSVKGLIGMLFLNLFVIVVRMYGMGLVCVVYVVVYVECVWMMLLIFGMCW